MTQVMYCVAWLLDHPVLVRERVIFLIVFFRVKTHTVLTIKHMPLGWYTVAKFAVVTAVILVMY